MKKLLKAYTSYTRTERMGIVAFSMVLVVLIVIKATMYMWVAPPPGVTNQSLNDAWIRYKNTHAVSTEMPAIVDLNTADSATLVALKGIGPAIAHKILVHRATVGPFTSVKQLLTIHHFAPDAFEALKQHLQVNVKQH